MDETTAKLAKQLQNDPALLQKLISSRDGRQLIQLLTRGDNGAELQQAAQSAVRGDTARMVELVRRIMQSPDGAALVERISTAMKP